MDTKITSFHDVMHKEVRQDIESTIDVCVCVLLTPVREGDNLSLDHIIDPLPLPDSVVQWQDCRPECWEAWGPEFNPRRGE